MFIYVAGPLTKGNYAHNVHNAIVAADKLVQAGHVPFIPHLAAFWELVCPHDYEYWMRYDLNWLSKCDGLVRLPGESSGADREVQYARNLKMPVYIGLEALLGNAGNY